MADRLGGGATFTHPTKSAAARVMATRPDRSPRDLLACENIRQFAASVRMLRRLGRRGWRRRILARSGRRGSRFLRFVLCSFEYLAACLQLCTARLQLRARGFDRISFGRGRLLHAAHLRMVHRAGRGFLTRVGCRRPMMIARRRLSSGVVMPRGRARIRAGVAEIGGEQHGRHNQQKKEREELPEINERAHRVLLHRLKRSKCMFFGGTPQCRSHLQVVSISPGGAQI